MNAALQATDVTVRYGRRTAVDHASLHIPRGSVSALLGRNGAGKSSLVRCLLGEQKPDAGAIVMFDQDVWTHRAELMERVGVVSEDSDAPPSMTPAQLARFCSRIYSRWDQPAFDTRLRRFRIASNVRFGNLSKGQKKQVMLALALASSPELLILDDPTLGLDVVARKALFDEVIAELADRGITILLTTHDLAGVETIADRVAMIHDGRIVAEEELDVLKARFRRIRFAQQPVALESASMLAARVKTFGSGTEAVVTNYDDVTFERFRSSANVYAVEPMSLEEIFIAVVGENGEES